MRLFLVAVLLSCFACSAYAQQAAEPITLENLEKVGLLQDIRFDSSYVDIEIGPQPGELLLYLGNHVKVVDEKNLQPKRSIEKQQAKGYRFSKDRSLLSWMNGNKITIRDEATGKTFEIDGGEDPGSAVFSPDNRVVAIADMVSTEGGEGAGYSLLRIFDAKTGELIKKIEAFKKGYGGLSPVFSPDGKILAVGNRNYETKLYDTETWSLQHTLGKRMTHEIAFSPDGKTLAAGYVDGHIGLWDVNTGKAVHMIESGCYRIHSISWNPTGDLLATSGPRGNRHSAGNTWTQVPGKVQVWNAKTFTLARDMMDVLWSGSVRFTPDGTRLIASVTRRDTLEPGCRVAVWTTNAPPSEDETEPKANVPSILLAGSITLPEVGGPIAEVTLDGKRVVAPLAYRNQIAMWNLSSGKKEFVFKGEHGWQIWQVAFSPDYSKVATASLDKTAKLWNSKTGDLEATLEGHTDRVEYLAYSRDGKYLFTGTQKDWPYEKAGPVEARLWNTETGELVAEINSFQDSITGAEYSPDGKHLLVASDDHTARLFDIDSGEEILKFDLGSRLKTIQFSPDGKTILTTSSGLTSNYQRRKNRPKPAVMLWDANTGEQLLDLPHPRSATASFNESGDKILTEMIGVVTYWETATGKELGKLRKPFVGTEVVFSPNRKYFVAFPPEDPAELWSVAEKKQLGEIELEKPYKSFFAPNHKTLYSLTRAGEFRWWSLEGLE